MVMYVTRKNPNTPRTVEEVHIGCKKAFFTDDVIEVQADGDELDRALAISGRPNLTNRRVMHFYGCDAKHIVGNWY